MDFWAQRCLEEMVEARTEGVPPPQHCEDAHAANTNMDLR